MIIKLSHEEMEKSMETITALVSDRMLQEDLKNLVVWVKDGKPYFAAYSGNIISLTAVDAEVTLGEKGENFVQLRAKDINDTLATLKGLKRTKVSLIEIHIHDNDAIMHVHEEPVNEEMENAEAYRQITNFRITKPLVKEVVRTEIQKINFNTEGVDLPTNQLLDYIEALYPTVSKEKRESTNNVLFSKEYVYTMLPAYAAILPNTLPEVLTGFRLQNSIVNFVQNFISKEESFTIHKEDKGNGMIVLTLKAGNSVAEIKCADMSRAYDMTNFVTVPQNGVVVDKAYLIDVLKRMNLSSDATNIEISIKDGVGEMTVLSKNLKQSIPVHHVKGEGVFAFSIRTELLSTLVFSHIQNTGDHVFLFLENGNNGNIILSVKDNSGIWQTKITGLAPAKGNFAWN